MNKLIERLKNGIITENPIFEREIGHFLPNYFQFSQKSAFSTFPYV